MTNKKRFFEPKYIAVSGIIAGLSFILTFLEFPIFPVLPFLKFDPSDSLIAMLTIIYGWFPSFIALIVKSFLFLLKSGSGGPIGILMNFVAGLIFITGMHFLYNVFKKSRIFNFFGYVFTSFLIGLAMCFINYYIALPVYLNTVPSEVSITVKNLFKMDIIVYFEFLIAFNVIKFTIDSFIAYLISIKIIKNYKKDERRMD